MNQLPTHDPSSIRFFAAQVDKTRRLPDIHNLKLGLGNTIPKSKHIVCCGFSIARTKSLEGSNELFLKRPDHQSNSRCILRIPRCVAVYISLCII